MANWQTRCSQVGKTNPFLLVWHHHLVCTHWRGQGLGMEGWGRRLQCCLPQANRLWPGRWRQRRPTPRHSAGTASTVPLSSSLPFRSPRGPTVKGLGRSGRKTLLASIALFPRPSPPAEWQWEGGREHSIAKSQGLDWQRGKANTPGFRREQRGKRDQRSV